MCGNRLCEAGETITCPDDCVSLQNCPEAPPGSVFEANLLPCSGHGSCNYLLGQCVCTFGYSSTACSECDMMGGFFWEEELSYCRRVIEGTGLKSGPGVDRSSGNGRLGLVALLCTGVSDC